MEFRWMIFLALWTLLTGPMLARPIATVSRATPTVAKPVAPLRAR